MLVSYPASFCLVSFTASLAAVGTFFGPGATCLACQDQYSSQNSLS